MRVEYKAGFAAICGSIFGGEAMGQGRCDCTSIVGSCAAEVAVQSSFIEVTTNTEQCSRVDYFVDGTPFVALIVDGAQRQARAAGSNTPNVIVQSCQLCVDNPDALVAQSFGASLYSDGEPTRLIEVAPTYPPEAAAAGIEEGFVAIRFSVSADGTVTDPEVLAAEPPGVFEEAALAALERWRYTRDSDGEPQSLTERIEFNLSDEIFSFRPRAAPEPRPAVVDGPVPNNCIQEESRFDFGSFIDVSLVNACEEPLVVYSCSAGTGSNSQRWVCQNPERPGAALGSPAAAAANTVLASSRADRLPIVDRLEISRAPNGEYWWLACAVEDAACRSDGRQWIRSIDRQTASIDPQQRTRARLARSF